MKLFNSFSKFGSSFFVALLAAGTAAVASAPDECKTHIKSHEEVLVDVQNLRIDIFRAANFGTVSQFLSDLNRIVDPSDHELSPVFAANQRLESFADSVFTKDHPTEEDSILKSELTARIKEAEEDLALIYSPVTIRRVQDFHMRFRTSKLNTESALLTKVLVEGRLTMESLLRTAVLTGDIMKSKMLLRILNPKEFGFSTIEPEGLLKNAPNASVREALYPEFGILQHQ